MIVPGVKPPTGIEPEEITRATATAAPAAGDAAADVGICEKETMACPQAEQNRLSVDTGAEHEWHDMKGGVILR